MPAQTENDEVQRLVTILVAVDDFTGLHIDQLREASRGWGLVRRISQTAAPELYQAELKEAQIVIGWPPAQWLPGSGIQLVQIGSSGWDAYEGYELKESGIALCNARGVYSIGVAEHCIAMMMALARRLPVHFRDQQEKQFRRHWPYAEITGTTACIVGLGSIGTELATRCRALGMKTVAVIRDPAKASSAVDRCFPLSALKTAVSESDHIFMTAPGNRENRKLFTREVLQAFPTRACFYNISRGTTVDEEALAELLAEGKIAGAGLDVTCVEPLPPESPLWSLGENVLITGHSAGLSCGHMDRFCALAVINLRRFRAGEPLENRVI
jgi:D-2-hydroxyacid dehydrogenase (NADP+)